MQPVLALLPLSDAFADVWARIASSAGAQAFAIDSVAELPACHDACALLLAAGGEEESALQLLEELLDPIPLPVAVVGTSNDYRLVASLCRAGANEYFALPGDLGLLHSWLSERVEKQRESIKIAGAEHENRLRYDFGEHVGTSPGVLSALARASRIIPHDKTAVLITGETGTGKELLARAIHFNGPRAKAPFVEINCSALPKNLIEAELFGFEKGAFTDARNTKRGLFEIADGGTLFLDEIGDLPLDLQPKLLRVLETNRFRRLGSTHEQKVDFRTIAATHVQLEKTVADGAFRQDLFYRLNVIRIHIPPLRDRGQDIVALANHFSEEFAKKYGESPIRFSKDEITCLLTHSWPGNIRELRNVIERAMLLRDPILKNDNGGNSRSLASESVSVPAGHSLNEVNRVLARQTVERLQGNKSAAAQALGISRKFLYSLLSDK